MHVKILDLERQYHLLEEELKGAVLEQISSGNYIGGAPVKKFEEEFASYCNVKEAISVNSGTDALVIALKACGVKQGDEVITTPFSFFATAEAIAVVGAIPVFVDIDENTFNIDPEKIESKINKRTKAILPVHIFGQMARMDEITEIARRNGLYVIEDACQAVGARYCGKPAGSWGDVACFSFFPTKNLGAFGDGGMITTNHEDIALLCRAYKEHGGGINGLRAYELSAEEAEVKNKSSLNYTEDNPLYNSAKYYNYLIGYNSRMDAIQARILSVKLKHLGEFNQKRSQNAIFYTNNLNNLSDVLVPQIDQNATPVWHQYAIKCNKKMELNEYLISKGVENAMFYPVPLHLQKAFSYLGYQTGDLPIVEAVCHQTICLPVYPELRQEEKEYIVKCIKDFVKR